MDADALDLLMRAERCDDARRHRGGERRTRRMPRGLPLPVQHHAGRDMPCGCRRPTTPAAWPCGRRTSASTSSTRRDRELAEIFGTLTGDNTDKFARCAHHEGPHGVPLLDACADRMVVRQNRLPRRGQRPHLLRDRTRARHGGRRRSNHSGSATSWISNPVIPPRTIPDGTAAVPSHDLERIAHPGRLPG